MSTKRPDISDDAESITTALYELDGAIRGAIADVIVGAANHAHGRQREATAATILAALIQARDDYGTVVLDQAELSADAVSIADALRAELAKGRP